MFAIIGFGLGGFLSTLGFWIGIHTPVETRTSPPRKPSILLWSGIFALGAIFLSGMVFFQASWVFAIAMLSLCLVIMGNDYDLYLVNHIPVIGLGLTSVFLGYTSWLSMVLGGVFLPFYVWLLFLPGKSEIAPLDLLLCGFAGIVLGPALGFVAVSLALVLEGLRAFFSGERQGAFAVVFCPCLLLVILSLQYMISLDSGLMSYFPDLLWLDLQIGVLL